MDVSVPFAKMHGLGNDFVVVDDRDERLDLDRYAAFIADRHFGIGCDQVLVLRRGEVSPFRMDIRNGDGSVAEMCGNGIRAFARYLWSRGLAPAGAVTVETLAGTLSIVPEGDVIRVDMGIPALGLAAVGADLSRFPAASQIAGADLRNGDWPWPGALGALAVSMGNPHLVIFTGAGDNVPLAEIGPKLEHDPAFPNRINVEFVAAAAADVHPVRVWERGAGATLACGTGACAAAAALIATGRASSPVRLRLPGGELRVEWDGKGPLALIGPATETFHGILNLDAYGAWAQARRK